MVVLQGLGFAALSKLAQGQAKCVRVVGQTTLELFDMGVADVGRLAFLERAVHGFYILSRVRETHFDFVFGH